jgi:hypothetical protein
VSRTIPGAFHAHDGWFFKRNEDGSVTVWAGDDGAEQSFEPSEWASIVASVSVGGETGATYRRALGLHSGQPL